MSGVKVKVSVEHLREEISNYLVAEGADKAEVIAEKVAAACAAFDFNEAVARIAHTELEKLVEQAARTYFKGLMESKDAHAVVIETLQAQIGMNQ